MKKNHKYIERTLYNRKDPLDSPKSIEQVPMALMTTAEAVDKIQMILNEKGVDFLACQKCMAQKNMKASFARNY